MKKLYATIACAALAMTAFGAQKTIVNGTKVACHADAKVVSLRKVTPTVKAAPQKAHAFASVADVLGSYKWVGEPVLSGDEETPSGKVIIEAAETGGNDVIIKNIYETYSVKATVDLTAGTITIPKQFIWHDDQYNQDEYLYKAVRVQEGEDTKTVLTDEPLVGTFDAEAGTFSIADIMWIGDVDGYWLAAQNMVFTYMEHDYEVTIKDYTDCLKDKFSIALEPAADVALMKTFFVPGMYEAASAVSTDALKDSGKDACTLNYDITDKTHGIWTFGVLSFDAAGVQQESKLAYVYVENEDPAKWKDYGIAAYTDDYLASVIPAYFESETISVPIEQNVDKPGYYRLVNPYENYGVMIYVNQHKHAEGYENNHYLYIDASKPQRVYIEPSALGFDFNSGMGIAGCMVDILRGNGFDDDLISDLGYFGTLEDELILFPKESLYLTMLKALPGAYQANSSGKFLVDLSTAGVGHIATDEATAPVEYYNLQGMRISNPKAGQLVIRRQGSKADKILVK